MELKSGFVGSVYDRTHFTPVLGCGICEKVKEKIPDDHELMKSLF